MTNNQNKTTMIKSAIIGKSKEAVSAHVKNFYENNNQEEAKDLSILLKESVSSQNVYEQQLENKKKLLK